MLATITSVHDKRLITQLLEDVVAVRAKNDGTVEKFYKAYKSVAKKIGV